MYGRTPEPESLMKRIRELAYKHTRYAGAFPKTDSVSGQTGISLPLSASFSSIFSEHLISFILFFLLILSEQILRDSDFYNVEPGQSISGFQPSIHDVSDIRGSLARTLIYLKT